MILVQDTQSMAAEEYKQLKPYPQTWARMHGDGRVFYSSLAHREETWQQRGPPRSPISGMIP